MKLLLIAGGVLAILVIVIALALLLNPRNSSFNTSPTPTPIPVVLTPTVFVPRGESGLNEKESSQLLEMRRKADEAYAARKRKIPFLTELPYDTNHFKVEITPTSDIIYVTLYPPYNPAFKNEALSWMRSYGAVTSNLEIVYINGQ